MDECARRCLTAGTECGSFDYGASRSRCYLNWDTLGTSSGVHETGCEAGDCSFVYYERNVLEPPCFLNETTGCCLQTQSCPSDCDNNPWEWDPFHRVETTQETCRCVTNDEFCIRNEEFCIKNEELCIRNEKLCIKNDEFAGWWTVRAATTAICNR